MNTRAWSTLEIKAVDAEKRIIEGIASTPTPDRQQDIVEPRGAHFKLPIPFLWQHDSRSPVGHVTRADVTDDGIRVQVQLAQTDEPGRLKDMLDHAWQSIKLRLVRGLSIGFRPLEDPEPIKGTLGLRFPTWEMMELSAVTIPANEEASILAIKSHDTATALGRRTVRLNTKAPGTSGRKEKVRGDKDMTITEQIKAFEAERASKAARIQELIKLSGEKGETLDEAQEEEYDGLEADVESIDKHLVRLRKAEKMNAEQAKPVDQTPTQKAASESRDTRVRVELEEKLEPGIEFARFAMCVGAARGDVTKALNLAQTHYPKQVRAIGILKAFNDRGRDVGMGIEELIRNKGNVVAGSTGDSDWVAPLVQYNNFSAGFVEYLRPRTIVGRFGQDGIPDFTRIPFKSRVPRQTGTGIGYWVGEGKPKPVTAAAFDTIEHDFHKLATISVLTQEAIRFSDPSSERLVRDDLAAAVITKMDTSFIDPAFAAVAGVNPASITNGVVAIGSTGNAAHDIRADLDALWATALAANLPVDGAVYIMRPALAMRVGLMMNALGQPEFPGLNMRGGSLGGVPVITSNHAPDETVVLVFANEILLSDDGEVTVDASREASLQMLDDPTNDSVTPTPTTLVSLWQTNSVALRAERFITWTKRRTQAVAVLNSVTWGVPASS